MSYTISHTIVYFCKNLLQIDMFYYKWMQMDIDEIDRICKSTCEFRLIPTDHWKTNRIMSPGAALHYCAFHNWYKKTFESSDIHNWILIFVYVHLFITAKVYRKISTELLQEYSAHSSPFTLQYFEIFYIYRLALFGVYKKVAITGNSHSFSLNDKISGRNHFQLYSEWMG